MEKIRFYTKKDWTGIILLFGPTLIITTLTILKINGVSFGKYNPIEEPLIISTIAFWMFLILAWKFTYYTMDKTSLNARMALFRSKTINIQDIKEIRKQNFESKIFGLSKDVLSIKLKSGGELNISPMQPEAFIHEIQKRNSDLLTLRDELDLG
jgi:hypothetical protein